jgi:hypothetical protein
MGEVETSKVTAKRIDGTRKDMGDLSAGSGGGFSQTLTVEPGVGCGRNYRK